MDWLKGKRTYVTMAVIILLSIINGWNEYCSGVDVAKFCFNINVPDFVFVILASFGIYMRKLANTGK